MGKDPMDVLIDQAAAEVARLAKRRNKQAAELAATKADLDQATAYWQDVLAGKVKPTDTNARSSVVPA